MSFLRESREVKSRRGTTGNGRMCILYVNVKNMHASLVYDNNDNEGPQEPHESYDFDIDTMHDKLTGVTTRIMDENNALERAVQYCVPRSTPYEMYCDDVPPHHDISISRLVRIEVNMNMMNITAHLQGMRFELSGWLKN